MLKWTVQPSRSRDSAVASSMSTSSNSMARVTDDPLASLSVQAKKRNKLGLSSLKRQQEEIYSVTRVNPLFEEAEEEQTEISSPTMAEDLNSNRSESRSPTSSGYESLVGDKHLHNECAKKSTSQLPTHDYRRHFVLGDWPNQRKPITESSPRIGKATLLHQNRNYVTRIEMSKDSEAGRPSSHLDTQWDGYTLESLPHNVHPVPQPIWPPVWDVSKLRPPAVEKVTDAIIEQNENYVTQILVAPSSPAQKRKMNFDDRPLDSIITDSLLMWTSYEFPGSDQEASDSGRDKSGSTSTSSEAAIRELSETLSHSKTLNTVSRALGKDSRFSTLTRPVRNEEPRLDLQDDARNSGSRSTSENLMKKVSQMKDLWEKSSPFRLAGRSSRLLVEEKDDEGHLVLYDNLNQEYVPRNGDINFTPTKIPRQFLQPFSSFAGMEQSSPRYQTINEAFDEMPEADQVSNSSRSSRSSGFRRVTFSADTVDNEPNKIVKTSPKSSSELKLSPQFLPRYQHPVIEYNMTNETAIQTANNNKRGQYYSSNLMLQTQSQNIESAKMTHEPRLREKRDMNPSGFPNNRETYGNLQLHPNYGAACPENTVCVDFTLDTQNMSLLQRKSSNKKIRRRLCCCILVLLGAGVFVVVVVGISLYLTHGQRVFGPI